MPGTAALNGVTSSHTREQPQERPLAHVMTATRPALGSTVRGSWHGATEAPRGPARLKPPQSGSWHFCANTPLAKSATRYTWLLAWLRPTLSQ